MLEMIFLVTAAIFLLLVFSALESWLARAVLFAIAALAYWRFGDPGGMAAAAILSVGLLIRRQMPVMSRF